tara:strand:- start:489 stop:719 length:231 start_codon:yes stop_codon:yes gene_type:complete
MPGRVLSDSVVDILTPLELRVTNLETYGWVIPPGGALTVTDSSDRTRIIIGLMSDGDTGIRIWDSSGVLQFDETYS